MKLTDRSPFAHLVRVALPGVASLKGIAAALDDRAKPEALRNWIRGRVRAPAWAIEHLRQRAWHIEQAARRCEPSDGLQLAGQMNLARYHARRAELKAQSK